MGINSKDLLGGLFSGGKVGPKFLPYNDLIQSYGMDTGSLFRVKMSAFKQPEIRLNSKGGNVNVDNVPTTEPLAEFETLYGGDSLSISHDHQYGEAGGLIGMVKNAFQSGGALGLNNMQLLNVVKGVDNLIKKDTTTLLNQFNSFSDLDVSKIYKGNTPPEFTVTFTLIASKDPLLEVVLPALIMTYLSYPRLSNDKDVGNILKTMDGAVSKGLAALPLPKNKVTTTEGQTPEQIKETENQQKNILQQTYESFKNSVAGKWRYRVGHAPPFWIVSSSNGIIYMPNAMLRNVTVNYFGPWVQAPPRKSLITFFNSAANAGGFGAGGILDPKVVFPDTKAIKYDASSFLKGITNLGGYPSYATVSMTFQHAFDRMFGEEWLLSMTGAATHLGATSSTKR